MIHGKFSRLALGLGALLVSATAFAADNYPIKDGAGATRTMRAKDVGGILHPMSVPTDAAGAAYSSSNGLPVAQQGAWTFGLSGAIPAGTNAIGTVGVTGTVAVTGTFFQATQPVSAASLPLPAGAATEATSAALSAKLPATLGAKAAAASLGVVLATDQPAVPVSMSAAPTGASTAALQTTGNTALASIDGKLPGTLGAKAAAASIAVVLPTDAAPIDTVVKATSTSASGTVTAGGTAQQLMAANAARRGFAIQNQSSGPLYVNCIGTATADQNSLLIPAGSLYESSTVHVGSGACSIIGATTGQAFYARQF